LSFLEQIFSGPRSRLCEATLLKADGTAIWASFHGTSDRFGRGARKWCRVAVLDITTRKQAEQALQAAQDELERRVEERTSELQRSCVRLAREIEERKRAEPDVAKELRFETLLADISTRFVNLPGSELDREIVDA
jgi:PAS domain-containing protein